MRGSKKNQHFSLAGGGGVGVQRVIVLPGRVDQRIFLVILLHVWGFIKFEFSGGVGI